MKEITISQSFLRLATVKKLLIIVGLTASGKTELALKLAKKYDGELLSADSRQIYRGLDIGTGKDLPVNSKFKIQNSKLQLKIQKFLNLKIQIGVYEIDKIPIWGLDLINPDQSFSVSQWVEFAKEVIEDIRKRDKLPIVVGGTGFWVKALLKGIEWGRVPQNKKLRGIWEIRELGELREKLKKLPQKFWESLTLSDWGNKRRLIRRIEVAEFIRNNPKANVAIKGIERDLKVKLIQLCPKIYDLRFKINERIDERLKQGLLEEIKSLLNKGYTFSDLGLNTIGYKEFREYFETEAQDQELLNRAIERWKYDEWDYARRQMLWNKKYFKD